LVLDDGEWVDEQAPDVHNLGTPRRPVHQPERASRGFGLTQNLLEGVSEMFDVIPIADSAARALTNAQLAQETVAVPQKYVLGMSKGDFVDA
jgi:hypothetical protein